MDDIVLPRTPIYKCVLAIIIHFPILAFFIGHFVNFLPSPEADYWGKYSAAALSFLFTSCYIYAVRKKKIDFSYGRLKNKTKRWIIHAVMPFFTFGLFYVSCAYGFGWMLHAFTNDHSAIRVTVSAKHVNSRSGAALDFKEYDYLWYKHLHYIPKDIWERIQIGDKVILRGTRSVFGFRPHAIDKINGNQLSMGVNGYQTLICDLLHG